MAVGGWLMRQGGALVRNAPAALGLGKAAVDSASPHLEDEVTVRVWGQPGARKKDLYYLAAAVGFGLVKRYDAMQWMAPPPGLVMIQYDAASNWVEFTLKYRTNLLSSAAASGISRSLNSAAAGVLQFVGLSETAQEFATEANKPLPLYAEAPIYSGPKDEVIGGDWNFTGRLSPGIPGGKDSINAPKLPFAGRTILTKKGVVRDPQFLGQTGPLIPTPNPRPVGDNRSRGTLVGLMFAALSDPGSQNQMTYPLPNTNNAFNGG